MINFDTIYLYRSAGLGDVLWTEPLLRQLAATRKKLVLFTLFTELFENYPLPNVSVRKIPPGWYRAILKGMNKLSGNRSYHKLDGIYEASPKMHMLHAYQRHFALPLTHDYPSLYLNEQEKLPIAGLPTNYVVLHLDPNAALNYRKVYGVNWEDIAAHLRVKGFNVVVTGADPIKLRGATEFKGSIRELIQLIYHSRFFMGVDSGPSHIAASLGKPSILFFGSVNPWFRHFPEKFKGYIMQQPCEFAGCYHEVVSGRGQSCKIVGDTGTPPCCIHSTASVAERIDQLTSVFLSR